MKYQYIFYLLATVLVLEVASDETTEATVTTDKAKICEPGTLTKVNCNTCICSNDGTERACTKKTCVEGDGENEATEENKEKEEKEKEEKVEVKPQNLPVPDEPVPTEIPIVARDSRRRRGTSDEETCEPGKNFNKDDCNQCECPESGKRSQARICTLVAC